MLLSVLQVKSTFMVRNLGVTVFQKETAIAAGSHQLRLILRHNVARLIVGKEAEMVQAVRLFDKLCLKSATFPQSGKFFKLLVARSNRRFAFGLDAW